MSPGQAEATIDRPVRIFLSAAELSGDRHAAELIEQIKLVCPKAAFFGVAGPAMQEAGCQAIEDFTRRATMLVGAVRLAGHAYKLVREVGRQLRQQPADLAVLVDSPALHLPMAKHIRAAGCPVLYYIAPQLWAWAPWRIKRVRQRVNRMAVILPFEEEYFRSRGVHAKYVGHPLLTQLQARSVCLQRVAELRRLGSPVVACLPGSRRHVIEEVLPGQIEVAHQIAERLPKAAFLFAAADERAAERIGARLAGQALNGRLEAGSNAEVLQAADVALCASGTATLEVAWHHVPMVIMYNGSKWGYRLVGRFLINTPHLSLVNILAGRRIVPEFMPYYTSTEPIAAEALDILGRPERHAAMKAELERVIRSLGTRCAAGETAMIVAEMLAGK